MRELAKIKKEREEEEEAKKAAGFCQASQRCGKSVTRHEGATGQAGQAGAEGTGLSSADPAQMVGAKMLNLKVAVGIADKVSQIVYWGNGKQNGNYYNGVI